jgi:hypothetical protein
MWILGLGLFKVIGFSESQMQASTVNLTNESSTSTVQIPSIAHVKVEPLDDSVFVLSDLEADICTSVDLSNTSPFLFRSVHSTPSQLPIHVAKSLAVLCTRGWLSKSHLFNVLHYTLHLHLHG